MYTTQQLNDVQALDVSCRQMLRRAAIQSDAMCTNTSTGIVACNVAEANSMSQEILLLDQTLNVISTCGT